jgi:S1-C subfamily serine protease
MFAGPSQAQSNTGRLPQILTLAALCALVGLAAAPHAVAQDETLDPSRLFELAKPAVFMVQVNLDGTVDIPTPEMNTAVDDLGDYLGERIASGELTQGEARKQMYLEVLRNWTDYIVYAEPYRTVEVSLSWMGTGWFITPDGYAITNVHVADPPSEELASMIAWAALDDLLDQDMATYLGDWSDDIVNTLTNDELESTQNMLMSFYMDTMEITGMDKSVLAAQGVTIPGLTVTEKGLPVEIIDVGETSPGKDIAVLKVAGDNFSTVELGDSSGMKPGKKVFAVGYPAVATFHPYLTEQSEIEPTFTQGIISAKKQMPGGWHVFQMDASTHGGNSGGPSFDETGKVIGVNTFGSIDQSSGTFVQGMNFCIPVEVAGEFIERNNIEPSSGTVDELYAEALVLLDEKQYKAAAEKLRQIDSISPGHPYVHEMLSQAEKNAAEGKDETVAVDSETVLGLGVLGIIGLLFLGVIVLVIVIVALTRKKGAQPASAQPPAAAPQAPHTQPAPTTPPAQPAPPAEQPEQPSKSDEPPADPPPPPAPE